MILAGMDKTSGSECADSRSQQLYVGGWNRWGVGQARPLPGDVSTAAGVRKRRATDTKPDVG